MPHPGCKVCSHADAAAIEDAIQKGATVRAVAKRFGMSPAAVHRHVHHEDHAKTRMDTRETERIDKEIRRLHHAQTAARKRRDRTMELAIAKELRSWFTLRVKAEVIASVGQAEQSEQISRVEAVGMARLIIETEVNVANGEIIDWLRALLDRVQSAKSEVAPAAPVEPEEE